MVRTHKAGSRMCLFKGELSDSTVSMWFIKPLKLMLILQKCSINVVEQIGCPIALNFFTF